MRKFLLVFHCILTCFFIQAQIKTNSFIDDPGSSLRTHNLHFTKLSLDLSFEPKKGLVRGTVLHSFTPMVPQVDSFFLDAIRMDIKNIQINGQDVSYRVDSVSIKVYPHSPLVWNQEYTLSVRYEARPRAGLYFIGWNDKNNLSHKQIWSQGEAIDNRHWIPMFDDKADKVVSDLTIRFDKNYQVLSNGRLTHKEENEDGTITWHYAMSHPHAPYLIMLGIGKYDIRDTHSASGLPMHLYSYPEWKDRVEPVYQHSEEMVDFYEKEIGIPFPWESYSQIPVQDYMFGAMENTTATIYGDFYLADRRGVLDRTYVAVNAHELAHQWFGDFVTARTDADIWLQESFATYYNEMAERRIFGEDHFNWERRGAQTSSLAESLKDKLGVANSQSGGARVYGKGAFVLHMLKYILGSRELYNKCIKHYLEKHAYDNVDTHDLMVACEEVSGMQLDWFWQEWLYRGGEPSFQVSFSQQRATGQLVVRQTQELTEVTGYKSGLYKMPVVIAIHYSDGTVDKKRYWIEKQTEILPLPLENNKIVDFVLFDPNNEILKDVHFDKPFAFLVSQALKAPDMLDRYDAVTALETLPLDQKRAVLINAYRKETFEAIKTEVVAQLAEDSDPQSISLLRDALRDGDVAVRKAALKNINPLRAGLLPEFEKLLTDSSYEIVENALQKLVTLNPSGTRNYLLITRNEVGNLGRNVQVRWLELSYFSTGKKEYADRLVALTSNSYEFRTRVNAMSALKRLAYFSEELTVNAVDGILSANVRLSGPANDLLSLFYAQDRYKKSISDYIRSQAWEPWQQSKLSTNGYLN